MLNKAILMGRLTRDPELRHTQSNMAVCSFSLAIDRDRKGPNGERQTDFIDCVAWGRQAEFVAQWFNKGAMAIVVGRVQSRRWQDQNGQGGCGKYTLRYFGEEDFTAASVSGP